MTLLYEGSGIYTLHLTSGKTLELSQDEMKEISLDCDDYSDALDEIKWFEDEVKNLEAQITTLEAEVRGYEEDLRNTEEELKALMKDMKILEEEMSK